MRSINQHIIHCSDSTFGDVVTIRRWHKERGFRDIGYHFVILPDGTIETGRSILDVGAHAKGYNRHSIGTCLIGKKIFTDAQQVALKALDKAVRLFFGEVETLGHCDLFGVSKTCPNFDVRKFFKLGVICDAKD